LPLLLSFYRGPLKRWGYKTNNQRQNHAEGNDDTQNHQNFL
jgi:hypothetical protein